MRPSTVVACVVAVCVLAAVTEAGSLARRRLADRGSVFVYSSPAVTLAALATLARHRPGLPARALRTAAFLFFLPSLVFVTDAVEFAWDGPEAGPVAPPVGEGILLASQGLAVAVLGVRAAITGPDDSYEDENTGPAAPSAHHP